MRKVPFPAPGEILLEEFLKPMGITPYRLAKDIGVPQIRISEILAGQRVFRGGGRAGEDQAPGAGGLIRARCSHAPRSASTIESARLQAAKALGKQRLGLIRVAGEGVQWC